jgi:RND family efflux transporter MFP subunit
MQSSTKFFVLLITAATLASCGGKTDSNAELKEKKTKLEELKKQQSKIESDITALEKEVLKLDTSAAKSEKSKLVALTTVKPATFSHYIDLQGKVEAVNISYVTPRNGGGQVKEIFVKKGDMVSKGQLLLKLDNTIATSNLQYAQKNLQSLKTQLDFAKTLYEKQKNLWAQNIGTEVQLITAKNNAENVQNQIKAVDEQVKLAQEQVNFTNVYADVNGVADDVNIRVGEFFTGMGQIKIVNTSDLKITTQIPENYLGKVKVGTHIKVNLPDINKSIDAVITVAGKLIDANSRSFFAEAKIPASNAFYPNQVAMVQILDYSSANAIIAPLNTIQTDDKGKFVMVAVKENSKFIARKKQVVVGELYADTQEIKSGLQAGDQIITDGYQSLYDGQLITTDIKQ